MHMHMHNMNMNMDMDMCMCLEACNRCSLCEAFEFDGAQHLCTFWYRRTEDDDDYDSPYDGSSCLPKPSSSPSPKPSPSPIFRELEKSEQTCWQKKPTETSFHDPSPSHNVMCDNMELHKQGGSGGTSGGDSSSGRRLGHNYAMPICSDPNYESLCSEYIPLLGAGPHSWFGQSTQLACDVSQYTGSTTTTMSGNTGARRLSESSPPPPFMGPGTCSQGTDAQCESFEFSHDVGICFHICRHCMANGNQQCVAVTIDYTSGSESCGFFMASALSDQQQTSSDYYVRASSRDPRPTRANLALSPTSAGSRAPLRRALCTRVCHP